MKGDFDGFSAADQSLRLRRGSGGLPAKAGKLKKADLVNNSLFMGFKGY
jgi:hypothetical protein